MLCNTCRIDDATRARAISPSTSATIRAIIASPAAYELPFSTAV